MIPLAEKNGKAWEISQEAEEPPCTGNEAVVIIENIIELNSGKEVVLFSNTMKDRGPIILAYLINWGFVSKENDGKNQNSISVLNKGAQLVANIRNKPVEEDKITTKVSASVKVGPVDLSAEHEVEKRDG